MENQPRETSSIEALQSAYLRALLQPGLGRDVQPHGAAHLGEVDARHPPPRKPHASDRVRVRGIASGGGTHKVEPAR